MCNFTRFVLRLILRAMSVCTCLVPVSVVAAPTVIGFLGSSTAEVSSVQVVVINRRLNDLGWREGVHYQLLVRSSGGNVSRFSSLVKDLNNLGVTLFVATSHAAARAVKDFALVKTTVFIVQTDPVETGLANSYSKPGQRMTGICQLVELDEKRIELLKLALPGLKSIGVLYDSVEWPDKHFTEWSTTASKLGLKLERLNVFDRETLRLALSRYRQLNLQALVIPTSFFVFKDRDWLLSELDRHQIPAIFERSEYVRRGGLMAYGMDTSNVIQRAAEMVVLILSGVPAGAIPIERPKVFRLTVNVAAAKKLDVRLSVGILKLADEVITSP
jgi:putative tryptophan/tyrosine transport system substrate-binding protein